MQGTIAVNSIVSLKFDNIDDEEEEPYGDKVEDFFRDDSAKTPSLSPTRRDINSIS